MSPPREQNKTTTPTAHTKPQPPSRMWGRPVRQATATSTATSTTRAENEESKEDERATVLVHRNELNEQQRPGSLVHVPLKFAKVGGEAARPLWGAKMLRKMVASSEGGLVRECDGLLLYTGDFIGANNLDRGNLLPSAMKKPGVLFITNHIDSKTSGASMVSNMRGIPITSSSTGCLRDVRTQTIIDPTVLEDDAVEESVEQFYFGGFITFEFTKHATPKPRLVRARRASTVAICPPQPHTSCRPSTVTAPLRVRPCCRR